MFKLEKDIQALNRKEILSLLGYADTSEEALHKELTLDVVLLALKKKEDLLSSSYESYCSFLTERPEFEFSYNQCNLVLTPLHDYMNPLTWDLTKRTLEEQTYSVQDQLCDLLYHRK